MGNVIRRGRKTHPSGPQENGERDAIRATLSKLETDYDLFLVKWSKDGHPDANKDGTAIFPLLLKELEKAMNVDCVEDGNATFKARGKKDSRRVVSLICQFPAMSGTARCSVNTNGRVDKSNREARLPEKNLKVQVVHHNPSDILHKCVHIQAIHLIPLFVHEGVNVNEMGTSGETALHAASKILKRKAIQMLLCCGANVNLTVPDTGQSALHFAVQSSSTKGGITLAAGAECVKLLLWNGAQVHLRDRNGKEAIHFACQGGREDLVSLLLDYGADINSLTRLQESPLFMFLEERKNLKNTQLLNKLLNLSYPLKITNAEACLPTGLILPGAGPLNDSLLTMISDVLSLQEICKFNIRKIFGGNLKHWMEMKLPTELWKSIYIHQEFSYASKLKHTYI